MAKGVQNEMDIVSLAEQAASEAQETLLHMESARSHFGSEVILRAFEVEQSGAAQLLAAFSKDPSFGDIRNGWIQDAFGGGHQVQSRAFPYQLINCVMDGQSAKKLVEEARAFAAAPACATEIYTPLAGATLDEAVSLRGDVDLLPWGDVPDGYQKAVFDEVPHRSMQPKGDLALRFRTASNQVLFPSFKQAEAAGRLPPTESSKQNKLLVDDMVRCVAALNESHVVALGHWAQFEQQVATLCFARSYSKGPALSDVSAHLATRNPRALDGELITRFFHDFGEFSPAEINVMRIGLDRLNLALGREEIVDRAIDLGISLEVMLLHGIRERTEMTYRASIRGATFLGGSQQDRMKTFKLLRVAYDLRSKAVHTGELKMGKKYNGPPPKDLLEDAANLCASVARTLIKRGSFPDWETEYVVGVDTRESKGTLPF